MTSSIPNTKLRFERRRQGLSLRELAYFAGCSHMTVQRAEAGTLDLAPAMKARIAHALRVPVAELWAPENGDAPGANGGAAEGSMKAIRHGPE